MCKEPFMLADGLLRLLHPELLSVHFPWLAAIVQGRLLTPIFGQL